MNSKDREQFENFEGSLEDLRKNLAYIHSDLSMKISEINSALLKLGELERNVKVEPSTGADLFAQTKVDNFSTVPKEELKVVERTVVPSRDSEPRPNLFVDDGSLHRDAENITPKVELAPRQRGAASQNLSQVICQRCNSKKQVHPTHVRDYYVCDGCLTGRSRKG